MGYILKFDEKAVKDLAELKKAGNKAVMIKIEKLLLELNEHPTTGTGQVEALRGNLAGYWSRRIDKFNRIIYSIEENTVTVTIISIKGHFGDK